MEYTLVKSKIALFASGEVGLAITEFLVKNGDEISILFLSGSNHILDQKIYAASNIASDFLHVGDLREQADDFEEIFKKLDIDFILTIYWPFLIPKNIISIPKQTLNFHPALLPTNRGWYPHVHSILDGTPTGVTLHKLDEGPDTGDIWIQKQVPLFPWDVASDIYNRLQIEIISLFIQNWDQIKMGKIKPKAQNEYQSNYHAKNELTKMDQIDPERLFKAKDLINLLRARTFKDKGYAYFWDEGKKVYVRIVLSQE